MWQRFRVVGSGAASWRRLTPPAVTQIANNHRWPRGTAIGRHGHLDRRSCMAARSDLPAYCVKPKRRRLDWRSGVLDAYLSAWASEDDAQDPPQCAGHVNSDDVYRLNVELPCHLSRAAPHRRDPRPRRRPPRQAPPSPRPRRLPHPGRSSTRCSAGAAFPTTSLAEVAESSTATSTQSGRPRSSAPDATTRGGWNWGVLVPRRASSSRVGPRVVERGWRPHPQYGKGQSASPQSFSRGCSYRVHGPATRAGAAGRSGAAPPVGVMRVPPDCAPPRQDLDPDHGRLHRAASES